MEDALEKFRVLHRFYKYHDYLTAEVAKKLGVTPRTIQRWLKGQTKPKEGQLKALSKYMAEKEGSRAA